MEAAENRMYAATKKTFDRKQIKPKVPWILLAFLTYLKISIRFHLLVGFVFCKYQRFDFSVLTKSIFVWPTWILHPIHRHMILWVRAIRRAIACTTNVRVTEHVKATSQSSFWRRSKMVASSILILSLGYFVSKLWVCCRSSTGGVPPWRLSSDALVGECFRVAARSSRAWW
jgi:hypothetical protein